MLEISNAEKLSYMYLFCKVNQNMEPMSTDASQMLSGARASCRRNVHVGVIFPIAHNKNLSNPFFVAKNHAFVSHVINFYKHFYMQNT